jgi:hypothetical protein
VAREQQALIELLQSEASRAQRSAEGDVASSTLDQRRAPWSSSTHAASAAAASQGPRGGCAVDVTPPLVFTAVAAGR